MISKYKRHIFKKETESESYPLKPEPVSKEIGERNEI